MRREIKREGDGEEDDDDDTAAQHDTQRKDGKEKCATRDSARGQSKEGRERQRVEIGFGEGKEEIKVSRGRESGEIKSVASSNVVVSFDKE